MERSPINLDEKFSKFSEHWSPKIIAQMGEFVWHGHSDTDEVFIVLAGSMTIHFRDGAVSVGAGGVQGHARREGRHGEHGRGRVRADCGGRCLGLGAGPRHPAITRLMA